MTKPKSAMKTRIWTHTRKLFWLATHQMTRHSSSLTLIIWLLVTMLLTTDLPSATASLTAQPATMASRDMKRVREPAARQNADNKVIKDQTIMQFLTQERQFTVNAWLVHRVEGEESVGEAKREDRRRDGDVETVPGQSDGGQVIRPPTAP